MSQDIEAVINYFARDPKFLNEKPYVTSFPVEDINDAEVSNHANTPVKVKIQNLRILSSTSIDIEGFTYMSAPTSLSPDDFNSRDKIRTEYFHELREVLHRAFPKKYTSYAFFDYEVITDHVRNPAVIILLIDLRFASAVPCILAKWALLCNMHSLLLKLM